LAAAIDKSDVLYYVAEMSPATMLRPRLLAAGADLERVHFPGYDSSGRLLERLSLPSGIEQLRQRILRHRAKLVLIDPIQSVLDLGCSPMASEAVRPLLELLSIVAVESHCAIVGAAHYRKGRSGSPLDWVAGSAAWTQASRSVLALGDHPREPGARVICSAKPGLGQPPRSRHYSLELQSKDVVWSLGAPVNVTAEELGEARLAEGERDALADALRFLQSALTGGGRPAKDVQDEAARACLSPITLRRAKERAGIKSVRHVVACGVDWYWELPHDPSNGAK
jgi:putative DNA primase/helicase